MHNFDPTNNVSWQLDHRGRVAVFIDGNNLSTQRASTTLTSITTNFYAFSRDGWLLRAFFYTGVDIGAEGQQGFLALDERNGFRVVRKS